MPKISGSILVITLGLFVIFTLFGLSSIYVSGLQNQAIEKQVASTRAFWIAEAGAQKGLWQLNHNEGDWSYWNAISSGYETTVPQSIGSGEYYEIQITSYDSDSPVITSFGYIPFPGTTPDKNSQNYAKRIIEEVLYENSLDYGIVGKDQIIMGGNAVTNSYRSDGTATSGDNGDIATNGTQEGSITINGTNAQINGDASTGLGGTITRESAVAENITHDNNIPLESVTVPTALINLPLTSSPTQGSLVSGNYKFSSIQLTKSLTITGPANIYLTGNDNANISLKVTGPGQLIINGGPVKIYTDGNVNISGQGIVNQNQVPSDFILYGTGAIAGSSIKFSGQSELYGVIYAPDTDISMDGQGLKDDKYGIYGAIVGKSVELSGNAFVHYDEKLSEFYPNTEHKYLSSTWREIF